MVFRDARAAFLAPMLIGHDDRRHRQRKIRGFANSCLVYSRLVRVALGRSKRGPDIVFFARLAVILAVLVSIASVPAEAAPLAKQLFGAQDTASRQKAAAFGSYSKGCAAGSVQLPETGPTWQAMRLSRNRNWGHPETIDFIEKLSRFAAKQRGLGGLYIGDISQPRGGPMLSGHRSHQIGLDIDIWMLPANNLRLSRQHRERISSISLRSAKGAYVNSNWTAQHHAIIRQAAKDKRTARIFVFPVAKVKMCNDEKGNRSYLRKIRPWVWASLPFPRASEMSQGVQRMCQSRPTAQGRWVRRAQEWVNNILNPPPPKPRDPNAPPPKKRREYVLADLPNQCTGCLAISLTACLVVAARPWRLTGKGAASRQFHLATSNPDWFGGFSALEMSADGSHMTVLSDRATILRAKIVRSRYRHRGNPDSVSEQSQVQQEQGSSKVGSATQKGWW